MGSDANNGKHYTQAWDGEWQAWARRNNREQCCDCGLVHVSDYRIKKGVIQGRYFRDNQATKRIRKRYKIKFSRPEKP